MPNLGFVNLRDLCELKPCLLKDAFDAFVDRGSQTLKV